MSECSELPVTTPLLCVVRTSCWEVNRLTSLHITFQQGLTRSAWHFRAFRHTDQYLASSGQGNGWVISLVLQSRCAGTGVNCAISLSVQWLLSLSWWTDILGTGVRWVEVKYELWYRLLSKISWCAAMLSVFYLHHASKSPPQRLTSMQWTVADISYDNLTHPIQSLREHLVSIQSLPAALCQYNRCL